ncbi:MAG: hypothetical protein ACRDRT_02205 [Pseudonocardiaceae bacterium]
MERTSHTSAAYYDCAGGATPTPARVAPDREVEHQHRTSERIKKLLPDLDQLLTNPAASLTEEP